MDDCGDIYPSYLPYTLITELRFKLAIVTQSSNSPDTRLKLSSKGTTAHLVFPSSNRLQAPRCRRPREMSYCDRGKARLSSLAGRNSNFGPIGPPYGSIIRAMASLCSMASKNLEMYRTFAS